MLSIAICDDEKNICGYIEKRTLDCLAKADEEATVQVFYDGGELFSVCRENPSKFDIIFLDPPYAEVFLENSINLITEIDILQSSGIIATERSVEKELLIEIPGYTRSKDYRYGNTILAIYRKD